MNQKIKISQLPAKGSNLAAQDLLEIAEFTGTGYVSKSITGAEIAAGATAGFVPETRTLTINGVTQDLSANRTFTISTGITIGSTAIASGVVGRVLFEGAGNVVQESSSLFWDATNNRLGIGTSSPDSKLYLDGGIFTKKYYTNTGSQTINFASAFELFGTPHSSGGFTFFINPSNWAGGWDLRIGDSTNSILFNRSSGITVNKVNSDELSLGGGGTLTYYRVSPATGFSYNSASGWDFVLRGTSDEKLRVKGNTGNVLINTTTDAGFRLDVNGTARVSGLLTLNNNIEFSSYNRTIGTSAFPALTTHTGQIRSLSDLYDGGGTNGITFYNNGGAIRGRIYGTTGNWFIGSSPTDAGFRLDVNGTARVSGALTLGTGTAVASSISYGSTYGLTLYGNTGSNSDLLLTDRNGNLRFRIVNGGNILQTATTINDIIIGGTAFAAKSIYTSAQYGLVLAGSAGSSFNFSLIESTGNNGLYIDSAGRAKIGAYNSTYNNSAILEAVSTTQGFLPPRMTTTQKNAIATPAAGLVVYDTTLNKLCVYTTAWETVTSL